MVYLSRVRLQAGATRQAPPATSTDCVRTLNGLLEDVYVSYIAQCLLFAIPGSFREVILRVLIHRTALEDSRGRYYNDVYHYKYYYHWYELKCLVSSLLSPGKLSGSCYKGFSFATSLDLELGEVANVYKGGCACTTLRIHLVPYRGLKHTYNTLTKGSFHIFRCLLFRIGTPHSPKHTTGKVIVRPLTLSCVCIHFLCSAYPLVVFVP
jgi:hypothetical protein